MSFLHFFFTVVKYYGILALVVSATFMICLLLGYFKEEFEIWQKKQHKARHLREKEATADYEYWHEFYHGFHRTGEVRSHFDWSNDEAIFDNAEEIRDGIQ